MNERPDIKLSREGQARRDAMLTELIEVVHRTRRARRTRRRIVTVASCAVILLGTGWLLSVSLRVANDTKPQFVEQVPSHPTDRETSVPSATLSSIVIRVQNDPTVIDRFRAMPSDIIIRMNDSMLIDTLATIRRPAGLMRIGDRIALSAPVSDAELGIKR